MIQKILVLCLGKSEYIAKMLWGNVREEHYAQISKALMF